MKVIRRLAILAAAGAAMATLGTGVASASALTPATSAAPQNLFNTNCADGIYSGYCGTQVSENGVSLTASGSSILGLDNPSDGSGNADFFWFRYQGGASSIAEFAPEGVASNKVMADQNGHLRLETATGLPAEQWTPCYHSHGGGGFTWTNVQTGRILQENGAGSYVTVVTAPIHPDSSELFNFVTP